MKKNLLFFYLLLILVSCQKDLINSGSKNLTNETKFDYSLTENYFVFKNNYSFQKYIEQPDEFLFNLPFKTLFEENSINFKSNKLLNSNYPFRFLSKVLNSNGILKIEDKFYLFGFEYVYSTDNLANFNGINVRSTNVTLQDVTSNKISYQRIDNNSKYINELEERNDSKSSGTQNGIYQGITFDQCNLNAYVISWITGTTYNVKVYADVNTLYLTLFSQEQKNIVSQRPRAICNLSQPAWNYCTLNGYTHFRTRKPTVLCLGCGFTTSQVNQSICQNNQTYTFNIAYYSYPLSSTITTQTEVYFSEVYLTSNWDYCSNAINFDLGID